ncbi:unnamed protein product [Prorocentrum cordatum]|uniref:Bifunctional lysine-specific demethylase and histidyl-hydroxylase n=1 Tax=Prorocentrum cordatum TaxID=2364126 RepID=A0ABN9PDM5_9DINO|nr:unnamed protein product [Polarella glacialis]
MFGTPMGSPPGTGPCSWPCSRTGSPVRSGAEPDPSVAATSEGDSSRRAPWPHRFAQRQDLRLLRGEVILMAGTPHVIVGYDGKHEVYLCWAGNADGGCDTSRLISVRRSLAHTSQKDLYADSTAMPPLPSIDHMGRPVQCEAKAGKLTAEGVTALPAAADGVGLAPGSAFSEASRPQRFSRRATPASSDGGTGCRRSPEATTPQPELAKQCTLGAVLKVLVLGIGTVARVAGQAVCGWWSSRAADAMQSRHEWVQRRDGTYYRAVKGEPAKMSLTRATSQPCAKLESATTPVHDDFQIHIPIVKPPGWQEVQPLVHQMPVTFDERGIKESLTVKTHRWGIFVDRQKARLLREIDEMKMSGSWDDPEEEEEEDDGDSSFSADDNGMFPSSPRGAQQSRDPDGCGRSRPSRRQDIRELEHMVERMEDWKDLSRYSGKSISMASTQRGNEMKIHILAFAEREDGLGVDFMWLDYRKSVEVRSEKQRPPGGVLHAVWAALPFLREPRGDPEAREKRWVDLLRRPDVAKFAIALAFKSFCDGSLREADAAGAA